MAGPQRPAPPPLAAHRPGSDRPQPFPPRRPPPGAAASRPKPPRKRGGGLLGAVLYLFLFALIVVGGAAAYLVINPPSDLIRETLAKQVKAKTGRDLVVAGPASVTFYPGLGVSLKDVSLSGPPGSNATLVKMAALDVSVKAMPLLSREVSVERIVLSKPIFDLRIDKAGKRNWDFAEVAPLTRYAQAGNDGQNYDLAAADGRKLPERIASIKALQLDDVRIEGGVLRFSDDRSGLAQQVEAVNVRVSAPSLDAPVKASGDLAWREEKTTFEGQLTNPRTVIEEKPAALQFKASNARFTANYDGKVLLKDGADLEGQISANSDSARALAAWVGTVLPPVAGFGPLSISGRLTTSGDTTSLKNATFGLDGATAKGDITVTLGELRPSVQANLNVDQLDLNKYLTTAAGGDAAKAAAPAAKETGPPAAQGSGDQIENLLNSPATKVYGSLQRAGWSSEPFNLALLGVADVDARVTVGKLLFQDLTVGQSAATVALKNRVLKTQFDDVQLYGGRGKGAVTIDGTGNGAGIGAAFALDGISARPFLKDAARIALLDGKAKVDLQITAAGANQLQLVESLNGKAAVSVADGAIVGFNLPGAMRGISQGNFSGFRTAPTEKTDFSQLTASFSIVNGVAQNSDLQLVSPLLRVTGSGAIQLPPRTIDYTVKPKLVASLEGQQGDAAASGIEIPVKITGPWNAPRIQPDLKGVIADPDKAVETVKELSKQYKGKNANEIVDDLFKKDEHGSSKAKDLLNKFLKPKEPETAEQPQQ